ncbi:hypothetical protein ACIN8IBEIGE_20037 [Acinetobacter sp. 8I-beige]|nr:hypothetical protein ACIN8IBEIGE_20037 [Acinetobacter sp. 8I-beige]
MPHFLAYFGVFFADAIRSLSRTLSVYIAYPHVCAEFAIKVGLKKIC